MIRFPVIVLTEGFLPFLSKCVLNSQHGFYFYVCAEDCKGITIVVSQEMYIKLYRGKRKKDGVLMTPSRQSRSVSKKIMRRPPPPFV